MRAASAQGITVDTKVLVQGLEVGRVRSITSRVDAGTGRVSFLARLSLVEQFEKGAKLRLPLGTRADIYPASQISSAAEVRLVLPDSIRGRAPGLLQTVPATLTRSNRLLTPLDSPPRDIRRPTVDRRGSLRETVTPLSQVSGQLNHFVEDISRRPYRLLTRVKPLREPRDTTKHADPAPATVVRDSLRP